MRRERGGGDHAEAEEDLTNRQYDPRKEMKERGLKIVSIPSFTAPARADYLLSRGESLPRSTHHLY